MAPWNFLRSFTLQLLVRVDEGVDRVHRPGALVVEGLVDEGHDVLDGGVVVVDGEHEARMDPLDVREVRELGDAAVDHEHEEEVEEQLENCNLVKVFVRCYRITIPVALYKAFAFAAFAFAVAFCKQQQILLSLQEHVTTQTCYISVAISS